MTTSEELNKKLKYDQDELNKERQEKAQYSTGDDGNGHDEENDELEPSLDEDLSKGSSLTGNFAFGGGVIHETGQRHRLLIPYVDENGIVQQPIFGVSSYGGKDIRKWAETLYEQLVEEKQQQSSSDIKENIQTDKDSDPIAVLKLRYAKGEITKKEYEEMRKTLESS